MSSMPTCVKATFLASAIAIAVGVSTSAGAAETSSLHNAKRSAKSASSVEKVRETYGVDLKTSSFPSASSDSTPMGSETAEAESDRSALASANLDLASALEPEVTNGNFGDVLVPSILAMFAVFNVGFFVADR